MMNLFSYGHSWGFSPLAFGFGSLIFLILFVVVLLLKGYALWHAARRSEKIWFVVLLIVNTFGILELVYLYFVVGKWHDFPNGKSMPPSSGTTSPDSKPQ